MSVCACVCVHVRVCVGVGVGVWRGRWLASLLGGEHHTSLNADFKAMHLKLTGNGHKLALLVGLLPAWLASITRRSMLISRPCT